MESKAEPHLPVSQRLLETVARTLRHEVGDLLQTVYSTVAILQERLPAEQTLERRMLADLRARAETCKNELDAVYDLVCPLTLSVAPLDLAELVGGLVAPLARRFSSLSVRFESTGPAPVSGDARKLAQAGHLLLLSACQTAHKEVHVRVAATALGAEWIISHDGAAAGEEQLSWLTAPFSTTHHALFGLGLAQAVRLAETLGGSLQVENLSEGGVRVRLVLPRNGEKG
jgi:signal transduction histidine kinase